MLSWISDKNLYEICERIVNKANEKEANNVNFDNIVDPFSALFDITINKLSYEEWLKNECLRQKQKSMQNMIGSFHQSVIGKTKGWIDLGTGQVVDLCNPEKKIIAEVKNKFNTTKGNHMVAVYDDIETRLSQEEYLDYTGYYVAILSKKTCDIPFTPPDNKTKMRRPTNNNIRKIDGASFYEIATGSKNALKDLYGYLPQILANITGADGDKIAEDPWFKQLFNKAIK